MALIASSKRLMSNLRPPCPLLRTHRRPARLNAVDSQFGQDEQSQVFAVEAELLRQQGDQLVLHSGPVVIEVAQ